MKAVLARVRARMTFANVTAATALFVALGGTSYAAISLPENSVGTREIRTGGVAKSEVQTGGIGSSEVRGSAIRKSEIATGGVGAAELHTDSVRAKEIKDGEVKAEEIATGAVGSDEIKDGSITAGDIDQATRDSFSEAPLRADVNAAGALVAGNGKTVTHTAGTGLYTVDFATDVSKCTAVSTIGNAGDPGAVTVGPGSTASTVDVHTFAPGATPVAKDEPFHVVLAC